VYSKNVLEAQDARIAQKRFLNQAARRQLAVITAWYQLLQSQAVNVRHLIQ